MGNVQPRTLNQDQQLKKWLRAQPATITGLQLILDVFIDEYNHRRPHCSLPHCATPLALFTTMPGNSRDPHTHQRIRHDKIDKKGAVTLRFSGELHHIGIGRAHVILSIQNVENPGYQRRQRGFRRGLTLDPKRDYQRKK